MKYIRCSAAIKSWIIEYMYFQSMLKAPSWMLKTISNFNSLKSCSLYFSPTPVRARATVHQDIPAPAWALHGLQFLGEITTCTVNGVLHGLQSVYLLHHGVLQRNLCPGACSTFSPCSSLRLVSCRAVSHPFSWLPGSIFLFFFFLHCDIAILVVWPSHAQWWGHRSWLEPGGAASTSPPRAAPQHMGTCTHTLEFQMFWSRSIFTQQL